MDLLRRYFTPPKESFFLFGPRGTGKSTWLKTTFPDALWLDLLDPETMRKYEAHPERLFELVEGNPEQKVIVIDEVQHIPELLSVVHSVIESKKDIQFILTGSSSRKLRREGVNLLGGRALLCHMHPFMASELGNRFELARALEYGMVPLICASKTPDRTLKAYAGLYLKEEVQAERLVQKISAFARFLEVVSFSHASLLNATNIARECEIKRTTVENYLQILEDLLLSFKLRVFTKRAQRSLTSHPKFYLFDAGVYRSLRPTGYLDKPEEIEGAALEGLIAQHLRAWIDTQEKTYELYFWRTRSGLEIDFILYGPDGIWAFEVKNNHSISPKNLRGLKAFKDDYPEAECICLYRGSERLKRDGILILPCETFLNQLTITHLLSSG